MAINQDDQGRPIIVGNRTRSAGSVRSSQGVLINNSTNILSPSELGSLTIDNWESRFERAFVQFFNSLDQNEPTGIYAEEYNISQELRSAIAAYRSQLLMTFTGRDVDYVSHGGEDDPNKDAREREEQLNNDTFGGRSNREILDEFVQNFDPNDPTSASPGTYTGPGSAPAPGDSSGNNAPLEDEGLSTNNLQTASS